MSCIRERRGRIVLDYRDGGGKRRVPSFGAADDPWAWDRAWEAERRLAFIEQDFSRLTFGQAAKRWLEEIKEHIDGSTWARYEQGLRVHILPALRVVTMGKLRRRRLKELIRSKLAERREDGTRRYTRLTVRSRIFGVLHTFLQWATDEDILAHNPASGMGRKLFQRRRRREGEKRRPRAMNEEQMVRWSLAVEQDHQLTDLDRLALHVMLDSGLRIGEAMGLQAEDQDRAGGLLHVMRQVRVDEPVVWDPKSDTSTRDVDLSERVAAAIEAEWSRRRQEALAAGRRPAPWIFFPHVPVGREPTRRDSERARYRIEKAMWRTCAAAGIQRFTPHALRHTYATLRAHHGADVKALQNRMGHATIAQTGHYIEGARPELGSPDLMAEILEQRRPQVVAIKSVHPTPRCSSADTVAKNTC